jgi:hypothetical protein
MWQMVSEVRLDSSIIGLQIALCSYIATLRRWNKYKHAFWPKCHSRKDGLKSKGNENQPCRDGCLATTNEDLAKKETKACQDGLEARLEKVKANPEDKGQPGRNGGRGGCLRRKVDQMDATDLEEAAVESIGTLKTDI